MFNTTMSTKLLPDAAHGTMIKQVTRMTAPAAQTRVLHLKRKHQFQLWASLLTFTVAAALFATIANAQDPEPAAASKSEPPRIPSANPETPTAVTTSTPVAPSAPATPASRKYSAQDVERAFNFLDSNRDGKISHAEAAGYKNIAKHFDAADVNKDEYLSKEEFDNALNAP